MSEAPSATFPQDPLADLRAAASREPFARLMGLRCVHLAPGHARVEVTTTSEMTNVFGLVHGGAVFTLLDEAFQLACNGYGTMALALNVSITYVRACEAGAHLTAEVREVAATPRTATYEARVTLPAGEVVAVGQALAYRKNDPLRLG